MWNKLLHSTFETGNTLLLRDWICFNYHNNCCKGLTCYGNNTGTYNSHSKCMSSKILFIEYSIDWAKTPVLLINIIHLDSTQSHSEQKSILAMQREMLESRPKLYSRV